MNPTTRALSARGGVAVLGALACSALVLSACGSGDSGAASSGTAQGSTGAASAPASGSASDQASGSTSDGQSMDVTLTEFHIAMPSHSLAAGTYTIRVKNAGKIEHALTVDGPGVQDKSSGDLSGGDSGTLTVTLVSGKYDFYCPVGNHKMEGMDETVTVK